MKYTFLLCFSLVMFSARAQDKNQFYALDARMNQTVLDSSKYILWIHQAEDGNWQWDYYYTWASLVKSTRYADHDGTVQNGRFFIYRDGSLDSLGEYDHGKKNGIFYKFKNNPADSPVLIRRYEYVQDSLTGFADLTKPGTDPADTGKIKKAEFPGGTTGWSDYLQKNLEYPQRASEKGIGGTAMIGFEINDSGEIKKPFILKSVEYSIDQEALKLIKNSGTWDPETKNGVAEHTVEVRSLRFAPEPAKP